MKVALKLQPLQNRRPRKRGEGREMHPENSTSVDGGETQRKTSTAAALLAEKMCQFAMSSTRSNLANPFGGSVNPFGSGGTLCSCSLVAQHADQSSNIIDA